MIKVQTLVDDGLRPPLKSEHGLSVWVEVTPVSGDPKVSVLLDCGQSGLFLQNADRLGVDVLSADMAVISHGHYDHSGGLPALVQKGFRAPVVIHPLSLRRRFSVQLSDTGERRMQKENGLPSPEALSALNVRYISGYQKLAPGVLCFCLNSDAPPNPRLIGEDGTPDKFPDEIFTLLSDGKNVMLYGGCTHHGLEQVLSYVEYVLGVSSLDFFIGGLHLGGKSKDDICTLAADVVRFKVGLWAVNHCTGPVATEVWDTVFRTTKETTIVLD